MNIENQGELADYLIGKKILPKNAVLKSQMLTGGVSNRTVKVDFEGHSWVMKQALPKLRVKGDWYSAPERIFYEAEAIRWFDQHLPGTCPKLTFEDKDYFIMAMEAIPSPFDNLKELFMTTTPLSEHFTKAGALLGRIHSHGKARRRIPELFFDSQFFESLRIDPYYLVCQQALPQAADFFNSLIHDTREDRYTFTHGDYSPKNLLVKNNSLILLDHEVAHFGDGTFDLGFFLAHVLSKANHHASFRKDFLTGAELFYQAYLDSTGGLTHARKQRAVRHALGCLLARVKGLSPLEYLSAAEKKIQLSTVLRLMVKPPETIPQLAEEFGAMLNVDLEPVKHYKS